jgi:hypothetical protein
MISRFLSGTNRIVIRLLICATFLAVAVALTVLTPYRTALASPLTQRTNQDDPVIELMQTGVGNDNDVVEDRLVFRVRAFDPDEGNDDGDGIDFVEMSVYDAEGNRVHRKREDNAGYCAFGEGTPNCTVWDFGDNNNRWPNGQRLEEGEHTLRARAVANDGGETMQDFVVDIFLTN